MPAAKKHKTRPSTTRQYRKAGWIPKVTLTMSAETQGQLDAIGAAKGLQGRSAVVRFLAAQELTRIEVAANPKK